MKLENILAQAQKDATENQTRIAIVYDPITNAEEDGDYNYCPVEAVPILFRFGTIERIIEP